MLFGFNHSWKFIDVQNVGKSYLKATNHQLMKIGQLGFVAVLKILRAVRVSFALSFSFFFFLELIA